jgi:hypothetical protein
MKISLQLAKLGLFSIVSVLSVNLAHSQTDTTKTFVDKLVGQVAKLEKSCAKDIKKFCSDVTPGEGRMVYCMQAHEDKISPACAYDLPDVVLMLEDSIEVLKEAVNACQADIASICGKVQPGQGRIAACLAENKATVRKDCADAIRKVEEVGAK